MAGASPETVMPDMDATIKPLDRALDPLLTGAGLIQIICTLLTFKGCNPLI